VLWRVSTTGSLYPTPWKPERVTQHADVAAPQHPRATAAFAMGLVSLIGAVLVLPAALGPLACYLGVSARRSIEREPQRWGGHAQATTGMVLGIIASVLLAAIAVTALVLAGLFALTLRLDTGYG
jgi:membrane glycosyltransferase